MFTENELEKDPLKEVAAEPYELLDKTRYDFSSKQLPEEREVQLEGVMNKLREECTIKGIMVRALTLVSQGQKLPSSNWCNHLLQSCSLNKRNYCRVLVC